MATDTKPTTTMTIPEIHDGVRISATHRITTTGGETIVLGLRYPGDDETAEPIRHMSVVPDGDVYPEQAVLNAVFAVVKKVNNDFNA